MSTTIFIGPINKKNTPSDGASIKNYHLLEQLRKLIPNLIEIDTHYWQRRPWILLKIFVVILRNRNAKYILSLNNSSANKIIKLLHLLCKNAEVIYWVIGGSIGKWMSQGRVKAHDYNWLTNIIVEGDSMRQEMGKNGLDNVNVIPNFKRIFKISHDHRSKKGKMIRFVFLSRINPEKGCDLIIDAANLLNEKGYKGNFSIDFYGPIAHQYEETFKNKINIISNINYKGFLDLRNKENYNHLSVYDAMLFPTYWHGEGCPGIIIDAYMCGLPILASDWNLNSDYIKNCETGILYKPKSLTALTTVLEKCILGEIDLTILSLNAQSASTQYDIENVLSIVNLKRNKIIND